MPPERVTRDLLKRLVTHGQKQLREAAGNPIYRTLGDARLRPVPDRERAERLLNELGDSEINVPPDDDTFFLMPRDRRNSNRISLLRVVARENLSEFRLYVLTLLRADEGVKQISFRFEGPESVAQGADTVGRHDFWHAQPTRDLRGAAGIEGLPDWVPQDFPAFPLDAKDAPSVAVSMMIAVYGLQAARDMVRSFQTISGLEAALSPLHFYDYWRKPESATDD